MRTQVLAWPRALKQITVVGLDVVLALVSTWIAFALRLDSWVLPLGAQWWVYGLAPALAIPIFIRFGLYRAIFRFTGQAALNATAKAVFLYAVLLTSVLLWQRWYAVPRTLGILQPLIFLFMVGASRAMARFWLAGLRLSDASHSGRLLIYGAGTAGVQTASALQISGQLNLIGFVDDDPAKIGRSINGFPIFASADILALVPLHQISDILLAMPSANRERRHTIIQALAGLPVHVRSLPSLSDLTSGKVTVQDFHELDVEDLLGRDPVPPNANMLAEHLAGRVVLVTGAGGSIGGELCRQIVMHQPQRLVLVDHNEFGLYTIHQELLAACALRGDVVDIVPLLGSVANYQRVADICAQYRPAIVYHAAAYKHVPLVEQNAGEGVLNNVFGTLNMARAALEHGIAHFVLVSTDKAVRPTNVMGATKRLAELVLQALAAERSPVFADGDNDVVASHHTCFTMVRFGNVLDSSGSVVPLFRRQLQRGGPLTVTHEEVTRYFMTIPEAAQLVLQAGAMAVGGDVFVLDMGEPVKIMNLARSMVQLSGLSVRDDANPQGDIEIHITGLRPGEKLYEELLIGDNPESTSHPRIMKAHEPFVSWPQLMSDLQGLQVAARGNDTEAIKLFLRHYVQGYQSTEFAAL